MNKFSCILSLFLCYAFCAGQKSDSLFQIISRQKDDTNKVNALHHLVKELNRQSAKKGLEYALLQNKLAKQLNFKVCLSYIVLAEQYDLSANYRMALYNNQLAANEAAKLRSPGKEYYLARINTAIAIINERIGNYNGAIAAENDAIKYSKILNDVKGVNISHFNLGNYYTKISEFNKAIGEYAVAENGFISNGDSIYLPYVYNAYGNVFSLKQEFSKALEYFQKSYALSLRYTPDDQLAIAIALQNMGEMLGKLGRPDEGIEKCAQSADLFKRNNDLNDLYTAYYNIADLYELKGDFKKSNEYYKLYVTLKDSVFNEDTRNTIHEMSIKFETEKKEQQNKLLTADNEKQQVAIYSTCGGLILMIGLVFSVYKSNRLKTKANRQLEEKNRIIHQQKQLVEEKQTEIIDSISYAKRLQEAILPPLQLLQKSFKDVFVYYQPKDIVAGDFYWCETVSANNTEYTFVAAADCTGHGVPGALVSVVCSNALNRAVHEFNCMEPGKILNKTRELVVKTFAKSEKNVKDGMDISLICIQRNTKQVNISWAGANNPVYILSDQHIKEIKPDKFPVGDYVNYENHQFKTHEIILNQNDRIYLFSDGLPDQFGGPDNKKYKYKRLQEKLLASAHLGLAEQKVFIQKDLNDWQGTNEQVDDILLIGFEV